ncbi:MAG: SpoIID/LytB domain-containing protein [Tissierellia bacterium]|nr:SpoIID/LytB domain-containing protein [Tissierellia bacterium]
MKKSKCLLILIFLLIIPSFVFAEEVLDIRVGERGNQNQEIFLSCEGPFDIYKNGKIVTSLENGKVRIKLKQDSIEIKTGNFSDRGKANLFLIAGKGTPIGYGKLKYRGNIKFSVSNQKLNVINQISVEDYLKGVLPKELSPSHPMETLKAQAIVSRSFALANKNKFSKEGFHLDDTTSSQVYHGVSVETSTTNQAVEETKGLIAYYNGQIANTIFHATSGGRTENIQDVWGGKEIPYLIMKEDPYSIDTNHATWEFKMNTKEFLQTLEKKFPNVGKIQTINIVNTLPSGRVKELNIIGNKGQSLMTGNQFRSLYGATKIKSTWFFFEPSVANQKVVLTANGKRPLSEKESKITSEGIETYHPQMEKNDFLDISGDEIKIQGKGYGHGVGMSQYGAVNMAKNGHNCREIISFYFPGVEIK